MPLARILEQAPTRDDVRRLVQAMEQDLSGPRLAKLPPALAPVLEKLWREDSSDPTLTRLALRLGSDEALRRAESRMSDRSEQQAVRLTFISAVGQSPDDDTRRRLLPLLDETQKGSEPIRMAVLAALEHDADPSIAEAVLAHFASWPPGLRARAITLLASRKNWSEALLRAVSAGTIDAKEVSVDALRQMLAHDNAQLAAAIETRWGKVRPATPGEKMSYVPVMGRMLNEAKGDLENGHKLFVKHCAVCHTLYGEGNKVGPDLTSADRKNRDALLLNILDPSGYVRPEYVAQTAVLVDGRVLTGLVVENGAQQVTLVDAKNQRLTLWRSEIDELKPSAQSLMPERLLETLAPQEVRDLFRYLQSEGPPSGSAPAGS